MKALLLFECFPAGGFRQFYLAAGLFICYFGFTKLQFDDKINPSRVLLTSPYNVHVDEVLCWRLGCGCCGLCLRRQEKCRAYNKDPHSPRTLSGSRCRHQDFWARCEIQTSEMMIHRCWTRRDSLQPHAARLTTGTDRSSGWKGNGAGSSKLQPPESLQIKHQELNLTWKASEQFTRADTLQPLI